MSSAFNYDYENFAQLPSAYHPTNQAKNIHRCKGFSELWLLFERPCSNPGKSMDSEYLREDHVSLLLHHDIIKAQKKKQLHSTNVISTTMIYYKSDPFWSYSYIRSLFNNTVRDWSYLCALIVTVCTFDHKSNAMMYNFATACWRMAMYKAKQEKQVMICFPQSP